MKKNRLITALALMTSLTLISCSNDDVDVKQAATPVKAVVKSVQATSSSVASYIPADTPLLVLFVKDSKYPVPQNLKEKMNKIYSSLGSVFKESFLDSYNSYVKRAGNTIDELDDNSYFVKLFNEDGMKKLGLSVEDTEFALYTIDLFPVLRLTLSPGHSLEEVLDEALAKLNEEKSNTAIKREVSGTTVFQFGDKEAQVMVSIKGNTLVASLAPTRQVDELMPKLLGFEKPTKSLTQSSNYHDVIAKYNYIETGLYWINFRDLADYFVNPAEHPTAMFDILKIEDNKFSATCKTEILEIFDKFPRLLGGSTKMDEHLVASHMIVELADGLGTKLATATGRIPQALTENVLSYGFSFDIAEAKKLVLGFVTDIETSPYKCELFSSMNQKATMVKTQLNTPLPPFVNNFKGFNFVVNELDLDLSKTDPAEMVKNIKAKLLLAVDSPEALKGMAEMMMPDLQKLGLNKGGKAVNVSSLIPVKGTALPINLDFVYMAMGEETIGLSLGEGTSESLAQDVSGESSENLLSFNIEADLYKKLFSGLEKVTSSLSPEIAKQLKMQNMMMDDMLWWNSESGTIGFTDKGFEFNMDINY